MGFFYVSAIWQQRTALYTGLPAFIGIIYKIKHLSADLIGLITAGNLCKSTVYCTDAQRQGE